MILPNNNFNSRILLKRLKKTLSELGEAQARLNKIVKIIADSMKSEVCSIYLMNRSNILNVELLERKDKHLKFSFDIQISDLKNFTNLISEIKQKNFNFKIIRHKEKKNAFIRRFFKNFKRN